MLLSRETNTVQIHYVTYHWKSRLLLRESQVILKQRPVCVEGYWWIYDKTMVVCRARPNPGKPWGSYVGHSHFYTGRGSCDT